MADIKAIDVKELREITNIGMMDCKKALVEAKGDKDAALKILKEKGLATAAKRADRVAKEGVIFIKENGNKASMVKFSCETDFVGKTADFNALGAEINEKFATDGESYINSEELKEQLLDTTAKTGEKIEVNDSTALEIKEGLVSTYLHGNKRVGVLLSISCSEEASKKAEVIELGKDICMQIAAMTPLALSSDEIADDIKTEQKEVFLKQMEGSGKPKEILEKIVLGKLGKFFSEQCLLEMPFVKDGGIKVKDLISDIAKKVGSEISLKEFVRMQIGK